MSDLNSNLNINWESIDNSIEKFSLNKQKYLGKVVSVYDGDTVTICFPFKNTMTKWSVRLEGIDTPEIRTKNKEEKVKGYEVRNILREKILDKLVNIECGKFDKYGRLLGKIYCVENNECINDWLVENNQAIPYDGGKKKTFNF